MSNTELEKRLRERLELWPGAEHEKVGWAWAEVLEAARIGAEIEREECATQFEEYDRDERWFTDQIALTIRDRGTK